MKHLKSRQIVWKINHNLLPTGENPRQIGNSPVPMDIYATGHGTEGRTCRGMKMAFRKVILLGVEQIPKNFSHIFHTRIDFPFYYTKSETQ